MLEIVFGTRIHIRRTAEAFVAFEPQGRASDGDSLNLLCSLLPRLAVGNVGPPSSNVLERCERVLKVREEE